MDAVVVASAPEDQQRQRVLARPGWTAERLDDILKRQLHDSEKRKRAHFIVETGLGLDHARAQVHEIIAALREVHYTGPLVIESFTPDNQTIARAAARPRTGGSLGRYWPR